ncbi:MAG: FAD-dependent oxidoreductase [Bacteroidota bacterium]
MRIAIIGAGVSGLTTAYYLKQNPLTQGADITIYEKAAQVGGNADTMQVILPNPPGADIQRWVDMGVNDFNLSTYMPLRELWQELNIMNHNKPCPSASEFCSPLIDTESFSSPGTDGSYGYRYSVDALDNINVPKGSGADKLLLTNDIKTFKDALADWYNNPNNTPEGKNEITVGEWLQSQSFSNEFIYGNLYPRINGMYFTLEHVDDLGTPPPSLMPLWMVAHYYILQEAYGQHVMPSLECSRQYFVGGSSRWLKFLQQKLSGMNVAINLSCGQIAVSKITVSEKISKMIITINGVEEIFDKVIFATHADDTFSMIDETFKSDEMVQALQAFTFSSSTVYVHQDNTFLGPNQDCNETYNIHIYPYEAGGSNTYPYSISYIVNMHQNDPMNPDPKIKNSPPFYITINPYWATQPSNILYQPNGQQAIAILRHCTLNNTAVNAQVLIDEIQLEAKNERSYYFAGSFARGAGLHMECIIHAQELANKIADPNYTPIQTYKFNSKERHFAPKYILDAITRIKK